MANEGQVLIDGRIARFDGGEDLMSHNSMLIHTAHATMAFCSLENVETLGKDAIPPCSPHWKVLSARYEFRS
jgi:hypothetical protein